jgi:hypothetical protein
MPRRTHFSAERLSPEGLALVHRGLREKWTYTRIISELKTTGERLAHSSLGRYASKIGAEMRSLRAAQEEAAAVIAELKSGSATATDMATALVGRALFETRSRLAQADPIALSREERERQKLDLKRAELELRREELALNRRKLEALEKRQAALREKAAGLKAAVDAATESRELSDDVKAKIRDLYGLAAEE